MMSVPNKPSGMRQFAALLSKDLRRELRTKEMLISMFVYAVLVIVVFGVALSFARPSDDLIQVSGGLLWAMILFTSLLGLNRSMSQEMEGRCIEGLLLAPMDRGVIFLAKVTSNLMFLAVVELIAVPLFWVFFSSFAHPADTAWLIAVPLIAGSIGIAGIGTMLSSMTVNTRGKDVMLALLFIPVIYPLLHCCVSATTSALLGGVAMDAFTRSVALAVGFDIIMILISWRLYRFILDA